MAKYHKYVFDPDSRSFVGDFESMYRAELDEGFDSWHQEDMRELARRICLDILQRYSWKTVLDIGCGKGAFTHLLKTVNNEVVGVDVSQTAISIAKARYQDIVFVQADVCTNERENIGSARFDLSVCMELLSYLPCWREVLSFMGDRSNYILVSLYLPLDPIGYVKSFEQLRDEFESRFTVRHEVILKRERKLILFGESDP